MPLPDYLLEERERYKRKLPEYRKRFEYPSTLNAPGNRDIKGPYDEPPEEQDDSNAFVDFGQKLVEGGVAGVSWGTSELLYDSKPWEEMNTAERSGWVIGEGLSLLAPWGAFGQMGKISSKVAQLGANRFIKKAASETVEQLTEFEAKGLLRGINKASLKHGKTTTEIIDGLAKPLRKELKRVVKGDQGASWMMDLGTASHHAQNMAQVIKSSSTHAVQKAFEKGGVGIAKEEAQAIAGAYVSGLSKGKYVNDVGHWLERGLGTTFGSGKARDFTFKYLGMVGNDALMMGAHGMGTEFVRSYAHDREMADPMHTLSHAGMMALAFPAIRLIGKGGNESLKTGLKSYLARYKGTDYNKILKDHGEGTIKDLLRVQVTGSYKDLYNRSTLGSMKFSGVKRPGRGTTPTWSDGDAIKRAISGGEMAADDAINVLNQMKGVVSKHAVEKWGPRFISDAWQSSGRMAIGVTAMNPWILDKDQWGAMEGPELASHLFISALMTKGKGGWGRDVQRTHMADYTKIFDGLKALNVNTKNVTDVIAVHEGRDIMRGFGSSLSTTDVGTKIRDIYDEVINSGEGRVEGDTGYRPGDHVNVKRFETIYNLMKGHADEAYIPLDATNLSGKQLDTIKSRLERVEFGDGNTIKQEGFWGSLVRLTAEPAEGITNIYKKMASDLKNELGIDISAEGPDKMFAREIEGQLGAEIGEGAIYNAMIRRLADHGKLEIMSDHKIDYNELVLRNKREHDMTEEQMQNKFHEIQTRWMEVLDKEYDGRLVAYSSADNPYLDFLGHAQEVNTQDRIYRVITGTAKKTDKEAGILTETLDNLFLRKGPNGEGYLKSIDDYNFEGLKPGSKKEDIDIANAQLAENKASLRHLFQLRKLTVGEVGYDTSTKGEITRQALGATAGNADKMMGGLPDSWKSNFYEKTLDTYMNRIFANKSMDRRAIKTAQLMMKEGYGLFNRESGKLMLPTVADQINALKFTRGSKNAKQVEEMHKYIVGVLGKDNVEEGNFMFDPGLAREKGVNYMGLESLEKIYKSLGNEQYRDFLNETTVVLEKITAEESGVQKRVKNINDQIELIHRSLDPKDESKPIEPIEAIRKVAEELQHLVDGSKSETLKGNLGNHLVELQTLSDRLKQSAVSGDVTMKDQVDAAKDPVLDVYEKSLAATEPLQLTLKKIFASEHQSKNELASVIYKLQNFHTRGKEGLGLETSDAMNIQENLARKFWKLYTDKENDTKLFSEMLLEFNETGYFSDGLDIVRKINQQAAMQTAISNSNSPVHRQAIDLAKKANEQNSVHDKSRSMLDLGHEYGLVDKKDPNKFDPKFIEELSIDIDSGLNRVKDLIYDTSEGASYEGLTKSERDTKWQKFKNDDAPELLHYLLNQSPIRTAKFVGNTLEIDNSKPSMKHVNTEFFKNEGFGSDAFYFLEGTMSQEAFGRMQNIDLDMVNANPEMIQNMLTKTPLAFNGAQRDFIKSMADMGVKISGKDLVNMSDLPTDPLIYMRLSPRTKVMMLATDANRKKVGDNFEGWYNKKLTDLAAKDQILADTFKQRFGNLLTENNDSRHILESKMLLQYIDKTGGRGMMNDYIKELSSATPRESKLAEMETNMFKRGFLSDGGTTQPLNRDALTYIGRTHSDVKVRGMAKQMVKEGYNTGVLADENFKTAGVDSPFDIKAIARDALSSSITGTGNIADQLLTRQIEDIENIKSLDFSAFDGAKFVSERMAKLIFGIKGGGDWNGAKTIIMAGGDGNQMLGKGYMVYHPDIAKTMPKGMDMMIGESSAKTYDGKNLSGGEIVPFDYQNGKMGDFLRDYSVTFKPDNVMQLPLESIGISFHSKNAKGVNISPSLFDWQKAETVRHASKDWLKLETVLSEITTKWTYRDSNKELAKLMIQFDEQNRDGWQFTDGDTGITKKLIAYGAGNDNPNVAPIVERLLRSQDFQSLNKINTVLGEDNYISPNVRGDLSMPGYAEFYRATGDKNNPYIKTARATAQFGGIALNENTMKRPMGSGTHLNTILKEKFIARDADGIDWMVSMGDKGMRFYSPLRDRHSKDPESHLRGGNESYFQAKFSDKTSNAEYIGDASSKDVQTVMDGLNKVVKANELTMAETHRLLNTTLTKSGEKQISVKRGNKYKTVKLSKDESLIADKMKLQLAELGHAMPTIGHDKIIHRIERTLKGMNGLTEINHWDLRVAHQRDNDGDHFTSFTNAPWNLMKDFARQNGMVDDFKTFPKNIDKQYINIFGFGDKGKAGENSLDVGFHKYANTIATDRRAIGQLIGARRGMTWLNLADFRLDGNTLLKDFTEVGNFESDSYKALQRIYNVYQSSVDVFKGRAEVMHPDAVWDYFASGTKPVGYGDKTPEPSIFESSVVNKDFLRSQPINRHSFKIIMSTLRKGNMIANDTWDEAGRRPPTVDEIKRANNDLEHLFNNPDHYVITKLMRQMGSMRKNGKSAEAKQMMSDMLEFFYPNRADIIVNKKAIKDFEGELWKGNIPMMAHAKKRFSFGHGKTARDRMKLTIGGEIMSEVVKRKIYHDDAFGGLHGEAYEKAGMMVDGLVERVIMARAFGVDPRTSYKNINMSSLPVEVRNDPKGHIDIDRGVNRGIAREILQRQHMQLQNSLRWFNEEFRTNPMKLENLQARVDETRAAIDILDMQMADNMVIDKSGGDIYTMKHTSKDRPTTTKKFKDLKGKQKVFVYELVGDIKLKEKSEDGYSLSNLVDGNGQQIDYGNLHKVGWFDKDGKIGSGRGHLEMRAGRTYIVDKNPRIRESMTSNEAAYGDAMFETTYGDMINPNVFIGKDRGASQFRDEVRALRGSIVGEYIKTGKLAREQKTLKNDIYEVAGVQEQRSIDDFMKRWMPDVGKSFDAADVMIKYILQPQAVARRYYKDPDAIDRPVFKTNRRLEMAMYEWAENNHYSHVVEGITKDVNTVLRGDRLNNEIGSHQNMAKDGPYDWESLGNLANPARTLTEQYSGFFASPMLQGQRKYQLIKTSAGTPRVVESISGDKIGIRITKVPSKDIYSRKTKGQCD